MRTLIAIAALSLTLAGCATYDLSTPEGVALYERDLAISQGIMTSSGQFLNQQTQVLQAQAAQAPVPQVQPYEQPKSTVIVSCKDRSEHVSTCSVR